MRIGTLLSTVVVGSVLLGCGSNPPKPIGRPVPVITAAGTQNCPQGTCLVSVTVASCDSGGISVQDIVVNLNGTGGGTSRPIAWVITTPGYVFSTDPNIPALAVKGSGSFFGSANPQGTLLKTTVSVTSPGLSHEYGLNIVRNSDGKQCPQFDPWVIE